MEIVLVINPSSSTHQDYIPEKAWLLLNEAFLGLGYQLGERTSCRYQKPSPSKVTSNVFRRITTSPNLLNKRAG